MRRLLALVLCGLAAPAMSGVLPEDRMDIMYHMYDGEGITIDGPSLLVRKQVGKSFSVVGNYYVDHVTSASVDVVTSASEYTEERKQWSVGVDYLRGSTTVSTNYVTSNENDYNANTYGISIKHDMLGQLTTIALSYAFGDDTIGRVNDDAFSRELKRQQYSISLTQILTRNLIASVNYETVTDEGFINNPYRRVRFLNPDEPLGYEWEAELYPRTRTSNALGFRAKYFLPYRAALEGEYRYFSDTWDMEGHTASIGYTQPWRNWTFFFKYRVHDQQGASFFSDLFERSEQTNFRGRDKELSDMSTQTFQVKASYEFLNDPAGWGGWLKRGAVTASYDMLLADYEEFRDLRVTAPVGNEPFFELQANVIQFFVSFWY